MIVASACQSWYSAAVRKAREPVLGESGSQRMPTEGARRHADEPEQCPGGDEGAPHRSGRRPSFAEEPSTSSSKRAGWRRLTTWSAPSIEHLAGIDHARRDQVADPSHVRAVVLGLEHERRHVDLVEPVRRPAARARLRAFVHRQLVEIVERDVADLPSGLVVGTERRPQIVRARGSSLGLEVSIPDRDLDRRDHVGVPVVLLLQRLERRPVPTRRERAPTRGPDAPGSRRSRSLPPIEQPTSATCSTSSASSNETRSATCEYRSAVSLLDAP